MKIWTLHVSAIYDRVIKRNVRYAPWKYSKRDYIYKIFNVSEFKAIFLEKKNRVIINQFDFIR